jgi:hypothetical protein
VNLRLFLLRSAMPPRLRARLLDELALITARAFGAPPPRWTGPSFETRLSAYAEMTAAQAGALLDRDDPAAAGAAAAALRGGALQLGGKAKRLLGLNGDREALEALCAFYHHIGIEARRVGPTELEVSRCLFAHEFDETTCELIAALDEGFAAGLGGGGRLVFSERITAGCPRCRARLEPRGSR